MNDYEERQEARRERYRLKAEKADLEAGNRFQASTDIVKNIPMGQPILVGHHSEKRHRSDLRKSDNHMRKGIEAQGKAQHYRGKAAGVGKGGISSDDPDALNKLHQKLDRLEARHSEMKRVNAYWRKHKTLRGCEGVTDTGADEIARQIEKAYSWEKQPFPGYSLTNNKGKINQVRKRIENLEAQADRPQDQETLRTGTASDGTTFEVVTHPEDEGGRIWFIFDGKPAREVSKAMKLYGWRWSPNRPGKPWVRNLNNAGLHSGGSINP